MVWTIITTRHRSFGKAMLSQVSLCPRGRGWVGISGLMSFPGVGISGTRSLPGVGMSEGGGYVRGGIHTSGLGWDFRIMVTPPPPPDMGPRGYNGIHLANGRYASYWNAFLLAYYFHNINCIILVKSTIDWYSSF